MQRHGQRRRPLLTTADAAPRWDRPDQRLRRCRKVAVESIEAMLFLLRRSRTKRGGTTRAISFKGAPFPSDIMLMGVRGAVAYPLSSRHVEALREERVVLLAQATIQRWVVPYSPLLEEAFHRRQRSVWTS